MLPLDRKYTGPPKIPNARLTLKPAGQREFESTTSHPLHYFFTLIEPIGVQRMREAFGKLEAILFPTQPQQPTRDGTPNPLVSIFHEYLAALEKRNAYLERATKATKFKEPEGRDVPFEEKERLIALLEQTRDEERNASLRPGNLPSFGLPRTLVYERNQDHERVIELIDNAVALGGIELALCRLRPEDVESAQNAIWKFKRTFPAKSPIRMSLAVIHNYFSALKSYLDIQKQIIALFKRPTA